MFLWTPATGSIGFGMTVYSMVGFTMLLANCGAQLLAVPVLDQSVLLLDGLPSKAMSPICPCYLTHSWDSGWQTPGRVPHAGGVWACTPCLWGPLLLRDPLQIGLGPRGPSYRVWPRGGSAGVLVVERLCTDRRRLTHSAPLFTPTRRASRWQ